MSANPRSRTRPSSSGTSAIRTSARQTRARTAADNARDSAAAGPSSAVATAPVLSISRISTSYVPQPQSSDSDDDDFSRVANGASNATAAANNPALTVRRTGGRSTMPNEPTGWWRLSPARRHRMRLQLRDLANDLGEEEGDTEAPRVGAGTNGPRAVRASSAPSAGADTPAEAAVPADADDGVAPNNASATNGAESQADIFEDDVRSVGVEGRVVPAPDSPDEIVVVDGPVVQAPDSPDEIPESEPESDAAEPEVSVYSVSGSSSSEHGFDPLPRRNDAESIMHIDADADASNNHSPVQAALDAPAIVEESSNNVASVLEANQAANAASTLHSDPPIHNNGTMTINVGTQSIIGGSLNPDNNLELMSSPQPHSSSVRVRSGSSSAEPTPMRKRRRVASTKLATPEQLKTKAAADYVDDDDGSTCPICLDSWLMSGEHRLTSLKCGHLFGESCIKKWMNSTESYGRFCPNCKSKITWNDLRPIYAKRIAVVDNSNEIRLQKMLDHEVSKGGILKQELALLKLSLQAHQQLYTNLDTELKEAKHNIAEMSKSIANRSIEPASTSAIFGSSSSGGAAAAASASSSATSADAFQLARECTINICDAPGCRVLIHSPRLNSLILSQCATGLFTGYGGRFVEVGTGRLTSFLHMTSRQIRDIALDKDEELIAAASMERVAKVYSLNSRGCVTTIMPTEDKPIWSAAFDRSRPQLFYAGTQHGSTFVYDLRYPSVALAENRHSDDNSPVICIASVSPSQPDFPLGGFLVCKLQSVWFYEYTSATSRETNATRLPLCGPFISMDYVDETRTILVSVRPTAMQRLSQHVFAELRKVEQTTTALIVSTMAGSAVQAVMTRSTQMQIRDATVVAAYMQDTKVLQTWHVPRDEAASAVRLQALPIAECVMDTCAVYVPGRVRPQRAFLAALTETKCRIYKLVNNGD